MFILSVVDILRARIVPKDYISKDAAFILDKEVRQPCSVCNVRCTNAWRFDRVLLQVPPRASRSCTETFKCHQTYQGQLTHAEYC